jgi:hypothetical protein
VAQLGANGHGEVLEPGRVPGCYLGLRLDLNNDAEAAGVLVVAPPRCRREARRSWPGRADTMARLATLEYHECVPCCRTVIGGWNCRSTRCPEAPQPGVSGDPAAEEDARFCPDRMRVADVCNEQFLPAAVRAVRDGGDALSWRRNDRTNLPAAHEPAGPACTRRPTGRGSGRSRSARPQRGVLHRRSRPCLAGRRGGRRLDHQCKHQPEAGQQGEHESNGGGVGVCHGVSFLVRRLQEVATARSATAGPTGRPATTENPPNR